MRRILVTAISGDIGNGILKILREDKHCILFGCDINEIAVGMDLVEVFWQSKYAVEEGYVEDLLGKCREYHITHLIPVNEREIEVIGKARKLFEDIGVKLVIQREQILDACLDKYKTAMFLERYGFDVPATYLCLENVEEISGKFICKPRKSNGSKDIFVFENGDKLVGKNTENCVFQEYIDSEEEYTIGVFKNKAVVNVIAFKRELKNGYSNKVELSDDVELYDLAQRLAIAFDVEGYFNIQLRKADGKYYIFEINPRISGTVRFRHMLGFCDVLWWLDMLDGIDVAKYECSYRRAVGMRELNEKFLIME